MRSGAAQFARDPARLDKEIGETMDRGKLRIRIRQDGYLRLSAVRRFCQFRLEKCRFRQFASSAMERSFSTLLAHGPETVRRIDIMPAIATNDGVEVYRDWGSSH